MMPTLLSHLKPLSAVTSAVPAIDSPVRLSLNPVLDRRATVDGAWWPYSRDAAAELPGLIAAVDQRLGRTTLRVGVYRDAWDHIPRRIPARGRQVRVGWFRRADSRVVTLGLAGAEQIVLLVIAPGTARGLAETALTLATQDTTGLVPVGILTVAHRPAESGTETPEADGTAGWENEGGHIIDQEPQGTPSHG
jgi:hypothetical protein